MCNSQIDCKNQMSHTDVIVVLSTEDQNTVTAYRIHLKCDAISTSVTCAYMHLGTSCCFQIYSTRSY